VNNDLYTALALGSFCICRRINFVISSSTFVLSPSAFPLVDLEVVCLVAVVVSDFVCLLLPVVHKRQWLTLTNSVKVSIIDKS